MTNQERVWKEEKLALEERKRIDQMMKERQEERQIQELQELQEAAGGKKRLNRVEWMYSGPASGQTGTTEEMEGYLLGKRRVDGLLKGTENKKLEKAASHDKFMALQNANTVRDTASKVREDPMLAIKKQEQAAYESLMKDPVQRRSLLKATEGDMERKDKDHRHGHRKRHRHREHDDHRRNHKRRRTDSDDYRSHDWRHDYRARSRSSSISRSPTPESYRSPPPYYSTKRSLSRRRKRTISYTRRDDRSDSPRRRRSRSPYSRSVSPRGEKHSGRRKLDHSRSWHAGRPRTPQRPGERRLPRETADADNAAKLAAMQTAAADLDQDREDRLRKADENEQREREADEAARAKSAKYGGKGDFVVGLHRKAGELRLDERMRRGRGAYEKSREVD